MKKVLLLIAVVSMISTASFAQTSFGLKLGSNIAGITGEDGEGFDSRIGTAIGGFAKISLSEKFAFQPELMYSMQGAALSEGGIDVVMKADYLNIPLMAKYYLTEGLSLQAGPQIGMLMSAKFTMDGSGIDEEEDIKDEMKGMDFGLNFGAGYEFSFGLGLDLRYNLGLSNIADYDDADGKNSVVQFSVGYAF